MADMVKDNRKERPIRRVLRRKHSQEYFTGSGWTKEFAEAKSFPDCLEAARTCVHCGLSGIEMALRIEGGNADLYCTEFR